MRFLLALTIALAATAVAQADRHSATLANGKQVVAHTRLAPVVVHRVLPPYGLGIHVYEPRAIGSREMTARPIQPQGAPVQ